LPPEVQIVDCVELPKLLPINGNAQATPSIASIVISARYRAELHVLQDSLLVGQTASSAALVEALTTGIEELMNSEHLIAPVSEANSSKKNTRDKKAQGRTEKNIRPGITSLKLLSRPNDEPPALEFEIVTGAAGHTKPTDLLELLCPALNLNWRVTRLELLTQPSINFSSDALTHLNSI